MSNKTPKAYTLLDWVREYARAHGEPFNEDDPSHTAVYRRVYQWVRSGVLPTEPYHLYLAKNLDDWDTRHMIPHSFLYEDVITADPATFEPEERKPATSTGTGDLVQRIAERSGIDPETVRRVLSVMVRPWPRDEDEKQEALREWFGHFQEMPSAADFTRDFDASRGPYYAYVPEAWQRYSSRSTEGIGGNPNS